MAGRHRRARRWGVVSAVVLVAVGLVHLEGAARREGRPARVSSGEAREYQGFALAVRLSFKPLPTVMPGGRDDTPRMVALGRRLFFERGISQTKSQSCNDCHRLDGGRAGVDLLPVSTGATGAHGKRNSPTVLNAGFQSTQFWDGRAADLFEQAKGPVLNSAEMAMRSPEEVLARLKGVEGYVEAFRRAFPDAAEPMTFDNLARAVAAFERTLIARARFDRYLSGERQALTADEERGLRRFIDSGCVECHGGHLLGGRTLRKLGIHHRYENQQDLGRYGVTRLEEDRFVFKVPMLRNVTLTPPYFHDGGVATLAQAVRLMAYLQLDQELGTREIDEIVGFLHSLAVDERSERP